MIHIEDEEIKRTIEQNTKTLQGDGDFRSNECVKYLEECDVICTNPPFSLFRELFHLLIENGKKFLLISNMNAIGCNEVFKNLKDNTVRIGYGFGHMWFKVPDWTKHKKTNFRVDEFGQKWQSIGNAMWVTNLQVDNERRKLFLNKHYNPEEYPKYDNYDAIEVNKVMNIPMDYYGAMGVPISYMQFHDGKDFEIIDKLGSPLINSKGLYKRIIIKRTNSN